MAKRELIDTGTDKRYVRRDEDGKFTVSVDVGKSSAADQRRHSRKGSPEGPGRQRRSPQEPLR